MFFDSRSPLDCAEQAFTREKPVITRGQRSSAKNKPWIRNQVVVFFFLVIWHCINVLPMYFFSLFDVVLGNFNLTLYIYTMNIFYVFNYVVDITVKISALYCFNYINFSKNLMSLWFIYRLWVLKWLISHEISHWIDCWPLLDSV